MTPTVSTLDQDRSPATRNRAQGQPCSTAELCAFVEAKLRSRAGQERTLVINVPAPPVPVEVMLEAAGPGPAVLWAPPQGSVFAGSGAAHRIDPRGEDRLDALGREAQSVWRRLEEVSHPACEAPPPRLFGGLAFAAGSAQGPPWEDFGDGCFLLPRFRYSQDVEEAALSVAVRCEELSYRPRLVPDLLEDVRKVLETLAGAADTEGVPPWSNRGPDSADGGLVDPQSAARSRRREEPSPARWTQQVETIRRAISQGRFQKIVAARRLEIDLPRPVDGPGMLSRLAKTLPGSTRFAFVQGGRTFLGATPERLISRRGLRIETEALAGSITSEEGERRREEQARRLLQSAKDQLEHALVVEHIVERLLPFCRPLSWSEGPGIRELGDVFHLRTPIRGQLRAPTHVLKLVEALHPTPAVGGVPASEAVRWIVEREAVARGWYAGPIGWFDAEGDGEFAVALRSGLLEERRAFLYAGAGVVRDSDPDLEYLETQWKQRAILAALGVG